MTTVDQAPVDQATAEAPVLEQPTDDTTGPADAPWHATDDELRAAVRRAMLRAASLPLGLLLLGVYAAVFSSTPGDVLVACGVVSAALLSVVWLAWNRKSEGHHYSWEVRGSTRPERWHARLHGAEVGQWDDDPVVMRHYPEAALHRADRDKLAEIARVAINAAVAEGLLPEHFYRPDPIPAGGDR